MEVMTNCALARALSRDLREARIELTHRWLERIAARVALDPKRIFPSDELLDHVPLLISGIAEYLEDPADEVSADVPVIAKAMELGALRHEQGFDAHEILKEYEILGGVLFTFLIDRVEEIDEPCTRGELLACSHRLFRAIAVVQRVTTSHYLQLARENVHEREERLRGFNRTITHELKNRIGAVKGAAEMLQEEWIQSDPRQLGRFAAMALSNAEAMESVLEDLLALSRADSEIRQQRHILLPEAVAEVVRQLRQMAEDRGVEVRVRGDLPDVEVNASAVELCLTNYLSNSIKYVDPESSERWVEVGATARDTAAGRELELWVRDNGLGVPPHERSRLFDRFFRAAEVSARGIEGTGLGLSIVRETVEAVGGRAWAEFEEGPGSTFKIALPLRRTTDTA